VHDIERLAVAGARFLASDFEAVAELDTREVDVLAGAALVDEADHGDTSTHMNLPQR